MNPQDLTDGEVAEAFDWFGIGVRTADLEVLRMLNWEGRITLDNLAEYMWDHLMGEPDSTDVDEVKENIERLLNRPGVEDVRKAYWALRAVGELDTAEKIAKYGGLTQDETDHGEDLAEKWGVRL